MLNVSRLGAIVAIAALSSGASCVGPFAVRQAFAPAPEWECVANAARTSRHGVQLRSMDNQRYQWLVADWPDSSATSHKQEVGILRPVKNRMVSDTIIVISSWADKKPPARDVQVVTTFAADLFDAIGAGCKTVARSDRICELDHKGVSCA